MSFFPPAYIHKSFSIFYFSSFFSLSLSLRLSVRFTTFVKRPLHFHRPIPISQSQSESHSHSHNKAPYGRPVEIHLDRIVCGNWWLYKANWIEKRGKRSHWMANAIWAELIPQNERWSKAPMFDFTIYCLDLMNCIWMKWARCFEFILLKNLNQFQRNDLFKKKEEEERWKWLYV